MLHCCTAVPSCCFPILRKMRGLLCQSAYYSQVQQGESMLVISMINTSLRLSLRFNVRSNVRSTVHSNVRSHASSNLCSNIRSNARSVRSNVRMYTSVHSSVRSNVRAYTSVRCNVRSNVRAQSCQSQVRLLIPKSLSVRWHTPIYFIQKYA